MMIATGSTNAATAATLGIPRSTISQWRKHPKFVDYVNRLHDDAISESVGILTAAMAKAASVVLKLLDSQEERVQLMAVRELRDWVKIFRNDALILQKLEALEANMPHVLEPGEEWKGQ